MSGFAIASARGWELALVMLAVLPPLAVVGLLALTMLAFTASETRDSTAAAGVVAKVRVDSTRYGDVFFSFIHSFICSLSFHVSIYSFHSFIHLFTHLFV